MHQVVLATHSPGIIRWLPPEAIKVLVVDPTTGKVVLPSQSSPADEAFFYIGEPIAGKTTVIVEDELAKHLVMKALKRGGESFASRFEVKFYPGGSQTLWSRYLPVFSADGRSDTLVLFDGDRRPSTDLPDPAGVPEAGSEKLRETLNSCAGVRISFGVDGGAEGGDKSQIDSAVRGLVKWAREHVDYLPGAIPEAFVWNNMVKTVETEVFENNPDPKRRFDDLARKELGREPSENVSSQDILATQLRRLDGPYFHHRAVVAAAPEAEEYGVDVVFSDLKSAVDKTDVAQKFAGAAAITARIQEIAGGSPTLRLTHGRLDAPQQFDVDVKDAIKIVVDGNSVAHGAISTPNKPGIKVFRKEISSLFSTDPGKARAAMLEFALLTGVRAHPGSHLYREGEKVPQLGLGSVVVTDKKHYFLCLQASCDSVRLTKSSAFLFIPLVNSSETPEVVVPVLGRGGAVHCIGLSSPATAYAESRSIRFEPNAKSRTVVAAKVTGRRGLFFSHLAMGRCTDGLQI